MFFQESNAGTTQTVTVHSPQQSSNQQVIQLQQSQQTSNSQSGGIQIVQQIVTPSGEIQQIPVSRKFSEILVFLDFFAGSSTLTFFW